MQVNLNDKTVINLKIELESLNEAIRNGDYIGASNLIPLVCADAQRIIEQIEAGTIEVTKAA